MDNPIQNFGLKKVDFDQLVSNLQNGDENLFETIFVQHFESCRSYLMRECIAQADDAYDVTVETIIRFRQMLLEGKIQYGNLRFYFTKMAKDAYLKKIAQNKKLLTGELVENEADRADESTQAFDDEQVAALDKSWQLLGEDCRNLLRQHIQEGFKLKEIAQTLEQSEANMRKRKERCMTKLKSLFFDNYSF
ncbi:MAG: sigma-70 family RNA polymerase sigma factor [Saprospiraceae bacterium]|nr:sigma-70 family RNA polymerase sigma factor [Saprospiraceae bacterium]